MAKYRSIFETGMSSVGNGLGALAGGAAGIGLGEISGVPYASLVGGAVGAMVFDGLGKVIPTTLPSAPLPRLICVNGQLRLLGVGDLLLHQKLSTGFDLSPLFDRALMMGARDEVLVKASSIGGVPAQFRDDCLALESIYPRVARPLGLSGCQPALNRLMRRREPLSVICLAIQPAILATLLDMRDRLKIPMSINHDSANGVLAAERIESHMTAGVPFDVAFMPNAALLMARKNGAPVDLTRHYAFVMPIHAQKQHGIRRRKGAVGDGLQGINFMRFLGNGSAEEQFRGMRSKLDIAVRERAYDVLDYKTIAENLEGNVAALLWDPWYSWVMRSRAFISIPSLDYQYWMSLYGLRQTFEERLVARDFMVAFRESWAFCAARIDYCFHLLEGEPSAKDNFLRAIKYD
jgi:hypothetical protein